MCPRSWEFGYLTPDSMVHSYPYICSAPTLSAFTLFSVNRQSYALIWIGVLVYITSGSCDSARTLGKRINCRPSYSPRSSIDMSTYEWPLLWL